MTILGISANGTSNCIQTIGKRKQAEESDWVTGQDFQGRFAKKQEDKLCRGAS
jgi:hypothetical protein